jgi:4-hydroxybenzoate polyprenyltransferase
LRDLDGDRAEGVPTYPVVHGPETSRRIIDGLLLGSAIVLVVGLGAGLVGLREGLMLAAPAIQLAFYRPRYRRGLTPHDCIVLTHLGTGLLLFYLVGNAVWLAVGMPANVMLV